jgi:hypothetical protein
MIVHLKLKISQFEKKDVYEFLEYLDKKIKLESQYKKQKEQLKLEQLSIFHKN